MAFPAGGVDSDPDRPAGWWRRTGVRAALLVAAAAVIVAITVPRLTMRPASAPTAVAGGTEIVVFIPVGTVHRVTEFRWASPVDASRYVLVVRGGGTAEVLRRETANQQVDIGPDLAPRFGPGRYNWTVEALDREGRTRASSPIQSFEVR